MCHQLLRGIRKIELDKEPYFILLIGYLKNSSLNLRFCDKVNRMCPLIPLRSNYPLAEGMMPADLTAELWHSQAEKSSSFLSLARKMLCSPQNQQGVEAQSPSRNGNCGNSRTVFSEWFDKFPFAWLIVSVCSPFSSTGLGLSSVSLSVSLRVSGPLLQECTLDGIPRPITAVWRGPKSLVCCPRSAR